MRKIVLVAMVLLLVAGAGMFGCAPKEEAVPEELLPCKVDLVIVSNAFVGKESISVDAVFSIQNPNTVQVTLDSIEYALSADDEIVAREAVFDKVYIPAGAEARLTITSPIPIAAFLGPLIMGGKSVEEAFGIIGPFWKGVGDGVCLYQVEGEALITSDLGESHIPFKVQWQGK